VSQRRGIGWSVHLLKARQKLGKFRIERRLADGPIAAVYQAHDTIHGISVALKVPHQASMSEYFLVDFKREARLSSRLVHPNILGIRDASFVDKHFVIAMPLGEESLEDRMRRRIATATALSFVEQALAALAHAHRQSVIHCDIKPANFIVFPGNELRLTDFGFSKVAAHTLKASGSGTVGYIAPEQAVGRPMFQSDVFSLGLVIYELLAGHLLEWPYSWPPPAIDRLRRKLKPPVVDWLRKATEVRPEQRYKNAAVMYNEYKRLRNGAAKKKKSSESGSGEDDPGLWQKVLFKQFQRKYKSVLDTRHECAHCTGPIAESMCACPWCGTHIKHRRLDSSYPAQCPRCHHGSKLDWRFCAWCYGPAFEVESQRKFADRRYTARCASEKCRGKLMPFMRFCPWCRVKVKRGWPLSGSRGRCPSCEWGVDRNFWHHCPWCSKALDS
jgi:serine/threonine protein kinase